MPGCVGGSGSCPEMCPKLVGGGGRDFEGSKLQGGPYEEVGAPVLVGGGGRWPGCPAKLCPDTTCPEDDSWRAGGCIVPEPPAVVHTIDHNDFTGYTCACTVVPLTLAIVIGSQ